jgi:hypothetical protein
VTHYADHDEIAANALQICDDVRSQPVLEMYQGLARECALFPARTAQLLMCLAVWVDYECPTSVLTARAEAIAEFRVGDAERRTHPWEA